MQGLNKGQLDENTYLQESINLLSQEAKGWKERESEFNKQKKLAEEERLGCYLWRKEHGWDLGIIVYSE